MNKTKSNCINQSLIITYIHARSKNALMLLYKIGRRNSITICMKKPIYDTQISNLKEENFVVFHKA